MSTTFPAIRRQIAQRLNMFGGDNAGTGTSATFSVNGDLSHAIDTSRPEPDNEWNDAWIVINPGGVDNTYLSGAGVGSPTTLWRRLSFRAGWHASTGTFTLVSAVPNAHYTDSTVHYELYKTFRPEQWLQATNFAIQRAYPQRHRRVEFEVPEDPNTLFYDWGQLASQLAVTNPSGGPTLTAVARTDTSLAAGTYKVAYTYINNAGETLVSPTSSLTVTATQGIQVSAIVVPETATGVRYYVTEPGGTQLALIPLGDLALAASADPAAKRGYPDVTLTVPAVVIIGVPTSGLTVTPPQYNSTAFDVTDLHGVRRRMNPGQYPEVYADLTGEWYSPMGGTMIKLEYRPIGQYWLRFTCASPLPQVTGESDNSTEPLELILSGAEFFLWDILLKQSTGQNTIAWDKLVKEASVNYERIKNKYAMAQARVAKIRPHITPVW